MPSRKITVFTGTRAEYGLLYWLMKEIESDPDLNLQLLVSGAHLSSEYGSTFRKIEADGFKIDEKVEMLLSSDTPVGTAKSMGVGILGFADALARLAPDALVILGDRYEAFAVAQAAVLLRIPVIHLHGGEVTEGAYDDFIRHAITKLSTFHVTSTEIYRQRVIQLGESPDRVFNWGAIGLDQLSRSTFLSVEELSNCLNFPITGPYFVSTFHPATLSEEDAVESVEAMLASFDQFKDHQVIITYPNADDGNYEIKVRIQEYAALNPGRVLAAHSLGHLQYLSAVKHSRIVVGNSSSGIIEAPSFQVPTVNIGDRQGGRLAAKSVLHCRPTTEDIVGAINLALSGGYKAPGEMIVNPYGAGDVSSKIVTLLKTGRLSIRKQFYDLPEGNFREQTNQNTRSIRNPAGGHQDGATGHDLCGGERL